MQKTVVRRVLKSDAPSLIQMNIQSKEYHTPWVQPFADQSAFDNWFGRSLTGPNISFVAYVDSLDTPVGIINVSEIVAGIFLSCYLSYYGNVSQAGQGLVTDAVDQVIKILFDDFGIHRVEANIQVGNTKSINLVKRLNFSKEGFSPRYLKIGGEWRDHERWALVSDKD